MSFCKAGNGTALGVDICDADKGYDSLNVDRAKVQAAESDMIGALDQTKKD